MNSSTLLKDLVSSQSIIIKSRGLTRWIIPLDSLAVNQVISNWSPHSIKAKVLWKLFLSVHRLGLIYRLRRLLKKWILSSSLSEPLPFLTVS